MIKKYFLIRILLISMVLSVAGSLVGVDCSVSSPNGYTINYLDSNNWGDVLKNPNISKNIPNTPLSQEIVEMCKKGSVILKFGEGEPKILICAGIHGNEAAPNIATLRLIESIKNKKINGTIYIVPFVNPQSTSQNTREWSNNDYENVDPNTIANVPGTPGYIIVKFAIDHNITNIIDAHSGSLISHCENGFIFANTKPVSEEEIKWLEYIKKNVNPKIVYADATPPDVSIRKFARDNNIPTFTFEVERDLGSVSKWADVELNMLQHGLEYFNIFT